MNRLIVIANLTGILLIGIFVSNCHSDNKNVPEFKSDVNRVAALNLNEFVPDTTYETIFPWEDVTACLNNKADSIDFKSAINCPKCGLKAESQVWIEFNSPGWTWQKMCGRKGPLSICPKCKIQVQFICELMN